MSFAACMNMHGNPFPYDGMMDTQNYLVGDFSVPLGAEMDLHLLDPSLRGASTLMNHYQEWREAEQPMQRFLFEQQKNLFTASHMSFQASSVPKERNRPYEAIASMPHACEPARRSPLSSCSSAMSPQTDNDWCTEVRRQTFEDCLPAYSTPSLTQGFSDLTWPSKYPSQIEMPSNGVNPQVVQAFPDTLEVTYNDDEGYMDMDTKGDFSAEVNSRTIKQETFPQQRYRYSSDEGLGASLKSEDSPEAKPVMPDDDDVDAEGEDVEENEDDANEVETAVAEEEDADTDYKPTSSRRKSRRPTRAPPARSNKKNKVSKPTAAAKSKFACKACDHVAKDGATLAKHVVSIHTRPYVCTFSFAGCGSTFGNKNEWKRHVYSQHLGLQYWLCNVEACGSAKGKHRTAQLGSEFNRKDLFTQHLRRMHAPVTVKKYNRKSAEWDERVKALQASCLKIRREAPTTTRCPIRACAQIFEGSSSWDDRMEHVGRHLEKSSSLLSPSMLSATNGHADVGRDVIEQESDEFMIQWCLDEKIIERKLAGGFKLCLDTASEVSAEEGDCDADGEDE